MITQRQAIATEVIRVASESPALTEADVCQAVADRLHLDPVEVADIWDQAKQDQQPKAA